MDVPNDRKVLTLILCQTKDGRGPGTTDYPYVKIRGIWPSRCKAAGVCPTHCPGLGGIYIPGDNI
jgi:hypothetical protein